MEWISVKDKLPRYNLNVLLAIKQHHFNESRVKDYISEPQVVYGCRYCTNADGEIFRSDSVSEEFSMRANCDKYESWRDDIEITHWMPLPKPPEARDE